MYKKPHMVIVCVIYFYSNGGKNMLNFEEELEKFQPSLEIEQAEDAICQGNSVDILDLLHDLMQEKKEQ